MALQPVDTTTTDAESYKGNDIDSDGDGAVDQADDADTVDGKHADELGGVGSIKDREINVSAGAGTSTFGPGDESKWISIHLQTSDGPIVSAMYGDAPSDAIGFERGANGYINVDNNTGSESVINIVAIEE